MSPVDLAAFGVSRNGRGPSASALPTDDDLLGWGRLYIAIGLAVGTVYRAGGDGYAKAPVGGHMRVTRDPDELAEWLARGGIGGVFTSLRASGLVDLDLEVRPGGSYKDELARLEAELGPLPATVEFSSPRGGRHRLYSANPALLEGLTTARSHLSEHVELRVGATGADNAVTLPPADGRRWLTPAAYPTVDLPAPWYARRRALRRPRKARAQALGTAMRSATRSARASGTRAF